MKCIEVKEKLDALIDGEIGFSEQKNIESHLDNCANCQAELESIKLIGFSMKRTLPLSTPTSLDEKVFGAFEDFHRHEAEGKTSKENEKFGWFSIPRFAFATALFLFGLVGFTGFQIGKFSANEISIVSPEVKESKAVKDLLNEGFTENKDLKVENEKPTKIIEVPVIKEKIVEIPVVKEKVVTRIIYRQRKSNKQNTLTAENQNSDDSKINDYQIVAELKPQIIKTGETNED